MTAQQPSQSLLGPYVSGNQIPFKISLKPLRKSVKYFRDGHWNQKEKLKYSIFLKHFQNVFEDPKLKKQIRLFEMMSDFILTRNSNQCRSHHQKMEKYRQTLQEIISSVSQKYEPNNYKNLTQRYLVMLDGILQNSQKYEKPAWKNTQRKQKKRIMSTNDVGPEEQQDNQKQQRPKEPKKKQIYKRQYIQDFRENVQIQKVQSPQAKIQEPLSQFMEEHEECPKLFYRPGSFLHMRDNHQNRPSDNCLTINRQRGLGHDDQSHIWKEKRQYHLHQARRFQSLKQNQLLSAQYCQEWIEYYSNIYRNTRK